MIKRYGVKDDIMQTIVRQTGKTTEEIKMEKGALRQITMDVLYRQGGMTNPEIGKLFGVDYSAVSQERRSLRARTKKTGKSEHCYRLLSLIYQGSRSDPNAPLSIIIKSVTTKEEGMCCFSHLDDRSKSTTILSNVEKDSEGCLNITTRRPHVFFDLTA